MLKIMNNGNEVSLESAWEIVAQEEYRSKNEFLREFPQKVIDGDYYAFSAEFVPDETSWNLFEVVRDGKRFAISKALAEILTRDGFDVEVTEIKYFRDNNYSLSCVWGEECGTYVPGKANNGGGYFQPVGGAVFHLAVGGDVVIEVNDSSCGDFGTRIGITILTDELVFGFGYGSMDDVCNDENWAAECAESFSRIYGVDCWQMVEEAVDAVRTVAYHDWNENYDPEDND